MTGSGGAGRRRGARPPSVFVVVSLAKRAAVSQPASRWGGRVAVRAWRRLSGGAPRPGCVLAGLLRGGGSRGVPGGCGDRLRALAPVRNHQRPPGVKWQQKLPRRALCPQLEGCTEGLHKGLKAIWHLKTRQPLTSPLSWANSSFGTEFPTVFSLNPTP